MLQENRLQLYLLRCMSYELLNICLLSCILSDQLKLSGFLLHFCLCIYFLLKNRDSSLQSKSILQIYSRITANIFVVYRLDSGVIQFCLTGQLLRSATAKPALSVDSPSKQTQMVYEITAKRIRDRFIVLSITPNFDNIFFVYLCVLYKLKT